MRHSQLPRAWGRLILTFAAFVTLTLSWSSGGALAQPLPALGLEAYIGAYDLGDGGFLRIMLRHDTLVAEDGHGPVSRLIARGAGSFESVGTSGYRLRFATTPDAADMRVEVLSSGLIRAGRRLSVPPDVLARYVGTYPLSDTLAMVVTLEAGRLYVQGTGRSRHPLHPETDARFFVQDPNTDDVASLEFGRSGEQASVTVRQAGFEQRVFRK